MKKSALSLIILYGILHATPTAFAQSGWVINEFLADPPGSAAGDVVGDANGDGTRDGSNDEFVEIVNNTGSDQDISGWTISDAVTVRHTFPSNTMVDNGTAIVVFGGGTPTGTFGGAVVQTASGTFLGFNNGGDTITFANDSGVKQDEVIYGSEGGNNVSLTLDPDITGSSFVEHSSATGSGGALFSPGTKIDGSVFGPGGGPVNAPVLVSCNSPFQIDAGMEGTVDVTATDADGTIVDMTITNIDPAPTAGTITAGGFAAAAGATPATVTITVSDQVPAGTYVVEVTGTNDDTVPQTGTCNLTINVLGTVIPGWIINEFLADPATDLTGDSNGDGVRDSSDDEFVEIVNNTGANQDISGWTLSDSSSMRHTFPDNTVVADGTAIVVFGGGTPTGTFGGAIVQKASSGAVGLNNSGDKITFKDDSTVTQAEVTYGAEGGFNESLTLDPDVTGTSFVGHSSATGANGALFSPGTQIDGSVFEAAMGGGGVIPGWVINEFLADPATDLPGDSNGDGVQDFSDDEFVEIVNNTGADQDISGWTLSDSFSLRHTFPSNTMVDNGTAIVVFGGGTPTGTFGGAVVQTASSTALGLTNTGDTITFADDSAVIQAEVTYGGEAGNNESLTLDPDVTGTSFVGHSSATGANGALFSPGTQIDGNAFAPAMGGGVDLIFSEYVEGTSSNKAIEIFNGSGVTADLSLYTVELFPNGATTANATLTLSDAMATLDSGDVLVIGNVNADQAILDASDITSGVTGFNGNDAVALKRSGVVIDVIGVIGSDPGTEWGSGDATTKEHTLRRLGSIIQGDPDGFGDPSDITNEWEGFPQDTFDGLGAHSAITADNAPVVVNCASPFSIAFGVEGNPVVTATDADGTIADITITDITPTPAAGSITLKSFMAATDTDPATATLAISDTVPAGTYDVEITATNDDPITQSGTCTLVVNVLGENFLGVIINEFLADPAGDISGDANGDGVSNPSEDEFVEIVNKLGADQDISGWTVSDSTSLRHTFPANTVLPENRAIVVFGGGTPTGEFGGAIVQTASEGSLGLTNLGDTLTLENGSGVVQAEVSYGTEGGGNQSLNLDPDITGASFAPHSTAEGSGGALFSPGTQTNGAPFGTVFVVGVDLFFSEYIEGSGSNKAIEIYNGTGDAVDLSQYSVELFSNGTTTPNTALTLSDAKPMLANGDVVVIANENAAGDILKESDVISDVTFFNGDDALALKKNGVVIDVIGVIGSDPGSFWGDGDTTTQNHTLRRLATVSEGTPNGFADPLDITDQWEGFPEDDFEGIGAHPALGGGGPAEAVMLEIFQIQGEGATSVFSGDLVIAENNVVTGILSNGFMMQTPDAREDANAATSNGIFVFTGSAPAVEVGDLVNVTGQVNEFFDLTEFSNGPVVEVVSSDNPLPSAITLDADNPSPDPSSGLTLERYEGMRVQVFGGTTTAPTDRFGDTPVVAGPMRAFREPGIEFPGEPGLPVWDGNPEIFEVNVDGLGLEDVELPAGATFDAEGVIFFSFGDYQILPNSFEFEAPDFPIPVSDRFAGEFTVGSQNLEQFFSSKSDFDLRSGKFSLQIREVLGAPDILAVEEAGSLGALESLAARIHEDDANINYTAFLIDGNDASGLNVGFLVRDSIAVDAITQLAASERLSTDATLFVHDRPPLLLEGSFAGLGGAFPIDVLVVHNRSLLDGDTSFVQNKRLEQAQSIAGIVQGLQDADPDLHLVVIGDFNAFQFTDGFVDVVGQISGNFNPEDNLVSGPDRVDPDLLNQISRLPEEERYSFNFGGSSQVLDQVLTSQPLDQWVTGLEYGRGNADVSGVFEDDGTTPLRSSDHDGVVLFITTGDVFRGVPLAEFPGFRSSPWFGTYFADFLPWIYHEEHGWQYVLDSSTEDAIFVYDLGLQDWLFFNESTYRWWYRFGDSAGWLFTFEGNTPDLRFFAQPDSTIISLP